jgi:hypothetical protein
MVHGRTLQAMKITIITTPENGTIKRNRQTLIDALKHFEGKEIKISVERNYNKRSSNQNRYYWSCVVSIWRGLFRDEWGDILSPEETHERLKELFGHKDERVIESTGEVLSITRSTTTYTTTEMMEYQTRCQREAFEMFGAHIPEPNEKLELNL